MPNHITNEITCDDQRALSSLLNDGGQVDFAVLIPPPENIETGGCAHHFDRSADPDVPQPDGTVCWYQWNIARWGTKWNAYDQEVTEGKLRFDTAWSHPYPVVEALSKKHPDTKFEVKYADEDLGCNLGHYMIIDGQMTEIEDYSSYDDKSKEFAARLKYGRSYDEMRAEWGED